jgi:hypothetical protein
VHECRCGFDFSEVNPQAANRDLVVINAAIYRAAGCPPDEMPELDLNRYGFPPEMLKLGSILSLTRFVGSFGGKGGLRPKRGHFASTDLFAATEIGQTAASVLRAWPTPLREMLKCMVPKNVTDPAALNFNDIFSNFHRHLYRVLPACEFGFLHDAFESFVIEDWKGLIRGQHRFSWRQYVENPNGYLDEAEKMADLHSTGSWPWFDSGKSKACF